MAIETFEKGNVTVKIVEDAGGVESPREWETLTTMLLSHRRYNLADSKAPVSLFGECGSLDELPKAVEKEIGEKIVLLRVRGYEHGNFGMKAFDLNEKMGYPWDCQWDSGWLGICYIPYSVIRESFNVKYVRQDIIAATKEYIGEQVDLYSSYVNGECYAIEVEVDGEIVDRVDGYLGIDSTVYEAKKTLEQWVEKVPL